jgi:hypothetical protein
VRGWAIAPVHGGPLQLGVPALWGRGARSVGAGGRQLYQGPCGSWMDQCFPGAKLSPQDLPRNVVAVRDADARLTTWYDGQLAPATPVDVSLSRDASFAWLLLTTSATSAEVARIDGTTQRPVATVTLPTTEMAGLLPSPDDGIMLVSSISKPNDPNPVVNNMMLDVSTGRSIALSGQFAGWMPVTTIDDILAHR